jgi:hypothetical protein
MNTFCSTSRTAIQSYATDDDGLKDVELLCFNFHFKAKGTEALKSLI